MNRLQLVQRVRTLTRDFSNSIFRESDIIDFINEGIERFKQVIVELESMPTLLTNNNIPILIPKQYRHLLAVYSASRCFSQDERHYQATTLMNEFETKLEEMRIKIDGGELEITDENGDVVLGNSGSNDTDYVDTTAYYGKRYSNVDYGVEGVE